MRNFVANIIKMSTQSDMRYLVAFRCPRPLDIEAPFYACMSGCVVDGAFVSLARCNYLEQSKGQDDGVDTKGFDRVVQCLYAADRPENSAEVTFGTPVVRLGDEDDGDPS